MKINKKHSIISILVAALMVFAMMPMMMDTVFAGTVTENGITYTLDDVNQTAVVSGHTDDLLADITIPAIVNNSYKVTAVGNSAFWDTRLESVTFETGSNLTSIGNAAFQFNTSLKTVTFEQNTELKTIGQNAFNCCYSLETITIPASVTSLGESAFASSGLESVTFETGSNLTNIGESAFASCNVLTAITIPASVTSIGKSAFSGNKGLETVTFEPGSSLETIGKLAFKRCIKLTAITIPKSVTSLERSAFENSGLDSVTFERGSSLKTIGNCAFFGCGKLTAITIPASVTSIGEQAFFYNNNLRSITFEPESRMTTIGDYAFGSSDLAVIHYIGNENAWDNITKGNDWKPDSCSVHCVPNKTTRKATPYANGGIERYMCDEEDCADWGYGGTVISKPAEFILSETSYTFDGTEKKPEVSVKDAGGNIISESNYDVVYSNNTNAGTATAMVTFKGDKYEGSKNLTFKITAKKTTPTMTLSAASYTYDGKVKTPAVTVKAGSTTLKNDTDYTVSYASGRKNAGSYKVTVTLKGNYSGSASKTFTINKAANPLAVQGKTAAVKLNDLKQKNQKLAVKEVIKTTKKGQGTVTYAISSAKKGSKSFKKYFKVNKTTGKVTVKKGLKKGKYKLIIKVMAAGNGNYKKATKIVKVTIKVE